MTVQYVDEYRALGVGFREDFTDLDTAKAALLVAFKGAYPSSADSPLFSLSISELIGNESECISQYTHGVERPDNTRIRVTDISAFTETVLFGALPSYLERRAGVLMGRDSGLWGVWRKGVSEDNVESWVSVYTASLSDLGGV